MTCQQINKTFVIAIKLMIDFIFNICDRTFKAICFIDIQAHLTMFTTMWYLFLTIYVVFTTEGFLEVAIESRPEWDLNPQPLNSVQTL